MPCCLSGPPLPLGSVAATLKWIAEPMQLKKDFPIVPGYFLGRSEPQPAHNMDPQTAVLPFGMGTVGEASTNGWVGPVWAHGIVRKWAWICEQINPLQHFHPGFTHHSMEPKAVPWSPSTALPVTWKSKAILVPCKPLQIFSLFPISSWSCGRNLFNYAHSNR